MSFYDIGESDDCTFNVVGESFRMDNIRRVVKAGRKHIHDFGDWSKLGVRCWLVPEPDNKHDRNAVAVRVGAGGSFKMRKSIHVGYVPRSAARRMAPLLDGPFEVDGVVVGRDDKWGVKLNEPVLRDAGLL